jgi:hypothetical protein
MKTFTIFSKRLAVICILLICSNGWLNAQLSCPFPVTNNTTCDIDIAYEFLDANCLEICGPNVVTISPGTTNINCCQGAVYVSIHVREVNSSGASCGVCANFNEPWCPSNVVTTCPSGQTGATMPNCSCGSGGSISINPSGATLAQ